MWTPKYLDHKLRAQDILDYFNEIKDDPDVIQKLSEHFHMHPGSIYRYLKYMNAELPPRQRDKRGRFIKT